jgi:Sulfatase-modifying factor enzyme 1
LIIESERLIEGLESIDPDIFKLSAEVMLTRRFSQSIRINDSIEIDKKPITCAEYQLFIDAQRQLGINRQPDHWSSYRFSPGDATKAITGVRASDAKAFCLWLSEKGYGVYRLPKQGEIISYPFEDQRVGYWCTSTTRATIEGISSDQSHIWKTEMFNSQSIAQEIRALKTIHKDDLAPRDLYLNLNLDLEMVCDCCFSLDDELENACNVISLLTCDNAAAIAQIQDSTRDSKRSRIDSLELDLKNSLARAIRIENEIRIRTDSISQEDYETIEILQLDERDFMRQIQLPKKKARPSRSRSYDKYRDIIESVGSLTGELSKCRDHILGLEKKIEARNREIASFDKSKRALVNEQSSQIKSRLERSLELLQDLALTQDALDSLLFRSLNDDSSAKAAKQFQLVQEYLLTITRSWGLVLQDYEEATEEQNTLSQKFSNQKRKIYSQQHTENRRKYMSNIEVATHLYLFLLLLDLRRSGQMPAWESIRVVKDNS